MATFPSLPNMTRSSFASSSGGRNAFGSVPGSIGVPANPYQQVAGVAPGLPKLTDTVAGNIQSAAEGQLSTGTLNLLQDKAAQFGVTSGMPGLSGLSLQNLMQNIGLTSEALTQQGTKDYLSFLTGVGSTQTDPNLAAGIADRNATMAAAPDPRLAAEYQLGLLDRYLARFASGSSPASGGFSLPASIPGRPGGGPGDAGPYRLSSPGYGQNLIATASGVFPSGTSTSITNPGADYSSGIDFSSLYPNPFTIADEPYTPIFE